MATKWIVAVSYPGYNVELDHRMERLVGKRRSSSGYGLGYRDMDWIFDCESDAETALHALRDIRNLRAVLTSYDTEGEKP